MRAFLLLCTLISYGLSVLQMRRGNNDNFVIILHIFIETKLRSLNRAVSLRHSNKWSQNMNLLRNKENCVKKRKKKLTCVYVSVPPLAEEENSGKS